MNTSQYISKLREKEKFIQDSKIAGIAAATVHAEMSKRIFDDGLNTKGDKIGSYNTTDELYVNPNKSPKKFPTKGKTGKTKFANGESHKTSYFDSYKSYKASQGRETSFVDLTLWGDLRNNFKSGLQQLGNKWIVGVRSNNNDKIQGNEARFGEIFSATIEEQNLFKKIVDFEIKKILNS